MKAKYDIAVNGKLGFYTIFGESEAGRAWMTEKISEPANENHAIYCDDTSMAQDITDGAFEDGLAVFVNGRKYLGNNRVA